MLWNSSMQPRLVSNLEQSFCFNLKSAGNYRYYQRFSGVYVTSAHQVLRLKLSATIHGYSLFFWYFEIVQYVFSSFCCLGFKKEGGRRDGSEFKSTVAFTENWVQFPVLTLENSQPPTTNSSSRGYTAFLLASVQTYDHVVYILHSGLQRAHKDFTADRTLGLIHGECLCTLHME